MRSNNAWCAGCSCARTAWTRPSLPLTHEFLAQMLGTGRPSVSLAAGVLENAGLIENVRGTVKIINRKSLEEVACECYGVIQNFNGGLGLK